MDHSHQSPSQFHLAARRGDLDTVRQIIAEIDAGVTGTGAAEIRAALVNEPNEMKETALILAAGKGFIDIIVELLKHSDKDSLARKNKSGFDALHVAAREGYRDIVKVLLDHDPSLAATFGKSNVTPLISAAIGGHLQVVNLLLERVPGLVEVSKADGKNALHFAAREGRVEIVKALLESESQLARKTDKKGQTALHMAAKGTSIAVIKAILDADPAILMLPDKNGTLALHVATRKKRSEIVLYMQEISSYCSEGIDKTTLAFNNMQFQGYSQLLMDRDITARSQLERMLYEESADFFLKL